MKRGYRFGPVHVKNFGPFVDARYDLSVPGLTVVEGVFVGHGCDSNGSGKTRLLEAPVWCTFGRLLRKRIDKDEIQRLLFRNEGGDILQAQRDDDGNLVHPPDGCVVETHLVNGPEPVSITRYLGHPKMGNRVTLRVNGVDVTQGRDAMTQLAIEQLLGLDYDTFVNSVAFGANMDVRGFFTATDAERKAILERILGLGLYVRAERIARDQLRGCDREIENIEREAATLRDRLVSQSALQRELVTTDGVEAKRSRLRAARVKVSRASARLEKLTARVNRLALATDHQAERLVFEKRTYTRDTREYTRRRVKLERLLRAAEHEQVGLQAEIRTRAASLTSLTRLVGQVCPTCRQGVPDAHVAKIARVTSSRSAKRTATIEAIARERIEPLRTKLRALVEPTPVDTRPYDTTRTRWQRCKRKCTVARDALVNARAARDEFKRELVESRRRAAKVEEEIARTQQEIETAEAKIEVSRGAQRIATFWVEGFGNAGIKSFLIEAEIPNINRVATRFAQRLLGRGAHVRLSPTRVLKTSGEQREEMVISASIPGCAVSHGASSNGQQRRLDLCVLLALRDVVSRRNAHTFSQFFADELFDGLDETGEEFVVDLLRELSRECPVTLVTHSPRLKSIGDRVLTVRHENGVSTVNATHSDATLETT